MTHYSVAIIVPPYIEDIEGFAAVQMAPYDEAAPVEPYVCYTVEQAAADLADAIQQLELLLTRNEPVDDIERCRGDLAALQQRTPEQQFRERIQYVELFNEQGEPLSTHNRNSKWDWWVIGGGWDGWINGLETGEQRVCDNVATTQLAIARKKIPHAIITPGGTWHERGQVGWWGALLTETDDWDQQARDILSRYPDQRVVILDAHI
jgi:hypothetical protein